MSSIAARKASEEPQERALARSRPLHIAAASAKPRSRRPLRHTRARTPPSSAVHPFHLSHTSVVTTGGRGMEVRRGRLVVVACGFAPPT